MFANPMTAPKLDPATLLEAARICEEQANKLCKYGAPPYRGEDREGRMAYEWLHICAGKLRALAAEVENAASK